MNYDKDKFVFYKGMYINADRLKSLAAQLRTKIDAIKSCYNDMNTVIREIDGSNDNWQGEKQKKFNDTYVVLSSEYGPNVDKLEEFYTFLCGVIREYEERETDINKDIDNNDKNLDIN